MDIARLREWLTQHRTVVLGTAAGGVGLLALRMRSKHAGDAAAADAGGTGTGGQTFTGGQPYDSTASDIYNAISPELQSLRDKIDELNSRPTTPKPAPKPKPKPRPKPKPPKPKPKPKPAGKPAGKRYYTVVSGDTLSGIAKRFHVAGGWPRLYAANRSVIGGNPNRIHPGQRLVIP